jgi:hypothetical protein
MPHATHVRTMFRHLQDCCVDKAGVRVGGSGGSGGSVGGIGGSGGGCLVGVVRGGGIGGTVGGEGGAGSSLRSVDSRPAAHEDYEDYASRHIDVAALAVAAARDNPALARLALLLRCKGDPNINDANQRRPLHVAAADGKTGAACVLLSFGADPNATDRWLATPLAEAFRSSHDDLCQALVSANAAVGFIQADSLRVFMWDAIREVSECA